MPPQQTGGIPAAHRRARIPSSRMEFHVQRRWAAAIFAALQAYKVTDLVLVYAAVYPEQHGGLLLKWLFYDTAYLIALFFVQIPWLQFTLVKTLFLITFMVIFNVVLFTVPTVGLTGLFFKGLVGDSLGKLTAVSKGQSVNVKDILNNSSHILGRHTVHILPYGTAKLNPNDEVYCLQPTEIGKRDIFIPIILNNTTPRIVSIKRYDFDGTTTTIQDYSGRDIQRATEIGHTKEGIEYFFIKIRKTGVYKLEKIVSKDGIDVRLYNRQVFVFTCPYAKFKSVESADYCTGDQETLELEVIGVPPLNVEYKRKILNNGQKETNLKLNRIQPDNFDSPLQQLTNDKSINSSFFSTINGDYSWAATQHLTIQLNLTFDVASSQEFKLHRIIDGAGNEVDLSGMNSQVFTVHGRPVVKFQCSQTHPANLLIGQKSTRLPLELQGTGPFNLEYKYSSDDHEKEKLYKAKLNHGENTIFASSSGEYDLVSINDKYCKGQVMFPSSCQVVQPEMPYVKVTATPIPSECAGDNEVGMKFVAEFVGAPPYVLEYVVTKYTGRSKTIVEKKREFIDRSRHIFSYLPTSSGEYTYEFTLLDDAHYKKRPTQIPPFKQVVHPQPDAKFSSSSRQSVRTCLGEDMSVDVDLRGTGPFTLSWTIGNQLYSDTVEASKYTIKLPPFERAGHHIVSLVKIEDANGCVKDLEARDFTIDVRRDRPTAFFYTNSRPVRTVEITEGSITSLPIRLTGEGPWKVTYRNVELGDKSKVTKHFSDPNASIDVAAIGHYELLNVTDSICRGDVLGNQYLVKWLDKPTVEILDDQAIQLADGVYERAAVCQGATDSVDIQFSGCNPFYCSYKEFRSPAGHRDFKLIGTEEITSGMKRVRLPLKTGEPGKYRYVFDKLSDQRYTDPFPIKNLQLEQMVHATPTVKFTSKSASKERTLCVGESLDSSDMDPIFMEFTGVAPFAVEIGIRFQTEVQGRVIMIDNIMTKKYQLSLHDELKDSGTYHINLLYVNDANGCASRVPPSDDKKISIKALEIATISPIDSCDDVCVGDTIDFSLQGVSPFTVQYLFNGKPETVKAQSSKLKMIADKPGNITIVSVGDQRNKCRSFPKDVSRYIHEVPSSIVSGGKEIIENIREGDTVQAVVELVGTPPFEFEWRRSRLIWDQNNKRHYKGEVLESHMVYGVEEHRYYINTSVEGIIEIVSIKDSFCQYPK